MLVLKLKKNDFSPQSWTINKQTSKSSNTTYTDSVVLTKFNNEFPAFPIDQNSSLSKFHRKIAEIKSTGANFKFKPTQSKLKTYYDDFWLIINNESTPQIKLLKNDTIRICNTYFLIKELRGFSGKTQENHISTQIKESNKSLHTELNPSVLEPTLEFPFNEDCFCRICLETTQSHENPFIRPCRCSGGMGYMHLDCFNQWLDTKFSIKSFEFFTLITWDTITCESCKAKISESTNYNGIKHNIFDRFVPSEKFVFLKKSEMTSGKKNTVFVIDCQKISKFYIEKNGKISSRKSKNSHKIVVNESEIVAINKKKSFSLSVLVDKTMKFTEGSKQKFINGSSLLEFSVSKKFSFQSCLCLCRKSE